MQTLVQGTDNNLIIDGCYSTSEHKDKTTGTCSLRSLPTTTLVQQVYYETTGRYVGTLANRYL